jgi:hypothetical protein
MEYIFIQFLIRIDKNYKDWVIPIETISRWRKAPAKARICENVSVNLTPGGFKTGFLISCKSFRIY